MKKKKWFGYILASGLTLGAVSAANTPVFAASAHGSNTLIEKTAHEQSPQQLDADTQQKVDTIMNKTKTKLEALGVEFPDKKQHPFSDLNEEQQAKAKDIMKQVKEGTLTKDEAKVKLKALGIEFPKREERLLKGLNNEAKIKAKAILEEAKAEVEKLGGDFHRETHEHLTK
ncbi:hypothetical protein FZC66_16160 [Priestia megaterium]|nr:hypothetical protein FZC66_16160 [Priestia megaterium]